ncbi:unnamed protein product, partial [marine sediment metagenome]
RYGSIIRIGQIYGIFVCVTTTDSSSFQERNGIKSILVTLVYLVYIDLV